MQLIVSYTEGDGYTYSCQRDLPIEYESAEQLIVDIEAVANNIISGKYKEDSFSGTAFNGYYIHVNSLIVDQEYYPPDIYTVDEWFGAGRRGVL